MDLQIVSDSITALSHTKSLQEKIHYLESQICSLTSQFSSYKIQVKKAIQESTANYELRIQSLQQRIEALEMVIYSQQNSELSSIIDTVAEKEKKLFRLKERKATWATNTQSTLIIVLKDSNIWNCIKEFLVTEDILPMMCIGRLRDTIMKDTEVFQYMSLFVNYKPADQAAENKPHINYSAEQREINALIDKYVSQQYIVGKALDQRLKNTVQTLLRLLKPGDSLANKYKTAADLVLNVFSYDKTIELLVKTTSTFSKSPSSMGDWLNFINNTFSGLLYDSSVLYFESCELSKLKDILVDKLRRAKEQLKVLDKENTVLKEELKCYKENKEHLVARLHNTDLKLVGKSKQIHDLEKNAKKLEFALQDAEKKMKEELETNEDWKKTLVGEVKALKEKNIITEQQKAELILAYEDLRVIFKSFSLKL